MPPPAVCRTLRPSCSPSLTPAAPSAPCFQRLCAGGSILWLPPAPLVILTYHYIIICRPLIDSAGNYRLPTSGPPCYGGLPLSRICALTSVFLVLKINTLSLCSTGTLGIYRFLQWRITVGCWTVVGRHAHEVNGCS